MKSVSRASLPQGARGVSVRQAARLAQVSRALPVDLQRAGLIASDGPLELADVLVVKVLGNIPAKWVRPREASTGVSLNAGELAESLRSWAGSSDPTNPTFLVLFPDGFEWLPLASAAARCVSAPDGALIVPVAQWVKELATIPGLTAPPEEVAVAS